MFWSITLIIIAAFTWGYLVGKPTGMKEGYRNCMREVLKARCEGRTSIGSSLDDYLEKENERQKIKERMDGLDMIYGTEYAQSRFPHVKKYHARKKLKGEDEKETDTGLNPEC